MGQGTIGDAGLLGVAAGCCYEAEQRYGGVAEHKNYGDGVGGDGVLHGSHFCTSAGVLGALFPVSSECHAGEPGAIWAPLGKASASAAAVALAAACCRASI